MKLRTPIIRALRVNGPMCASQIALALDERVGLVDKELGCMVDEGLVAIVDEKYGRADRATLEKALGHDFYVYKLNTKREMLRHLASKAAEGRCSPSI